MQNAIELPPPPPGKFGWPWTEESPQLPDTMPDGSPWPRISIVTPSYNQGRFIEETIRSVLLQGYPDLEYIIIDGGSTDESVEIIRKYEPWLAYWVSEPDEGQAHAIDKGFRLPTGDIMAYINSDDRYMPYTFQLIARLFTQFQEVDWITGHSSFLVDECVISPRRNHCYAYNRKLFRLGFHTPWFLGIPQQVSTFWRRTLYQKAGGFINTKLWHAMDVDLWGRMAAFSAPTFLPAVIAQMRLHTYQKSHNSSAFQEIESGQLSFLPYTIRKILFLGMRTTGVRWLIRRLLFDGRASQFYWDIDKEQWNIRWTSAF